MLEYARIIVLLILVSNRAYSVERDTTTIWEPKRFEGLVEHFEITEDNGIWIGQEDRISYFDDLSGYTHYYARDGLPDKVLGMKTDRHGLLWVWGIAGTFRDVPTEAQVPIISPFSYYG